MAITSLAEITFWASVAAPVYAYLGYPALLACCWPFLGRPHRAPDPARWPRVSILLAAHNEEGHIRRKLENCLALDYPSGKIEVRVGSDGSIDQTVAIAREFEPRGVIVRDFQPRTGKMATVNRLVREATGEICVFSDVSELFDLDAVRALARHFGDPEVGAVTGNHIYNRSASSLGAGTSFYWKFQRFLQAIESRLYTVCTCDGTIYACRRELFPFPPDETINDDMAVPLGVIDQGKRVVFEPAAIARGDVLPTTQRFVQQKIRGQAGRYQIFCLFRRLLLPKRPLRWWIFVSRSVLPVLVPWFLVLALVSNLALWATGDLVYRATLGLQTSFYLAAGAGAICQAFRVRARLLAIPFFFVAANVGSLLGFFAYFTGTQGAHWRKVE